MSPGAVRSLFLQKKPKQFVKIAREIALAQESPMIDNSSPSRDKEVPIMTRRHSPDEDVEIFNLPLAKWAMGALGMMIAVVGKESLL